MMKMRKNKLGVKLKPVWEDFDTRAKNSTGKERSTTNGLTTEEKIKIAKSMCREKIEPIKYVENQKGLY